MGSLLRKSHKDLGVVLNFDYHFGIVLYIVRKKSIFILKGPFLGDLDS